MYRFLWIVAGLILVPMVTLAVWQVADSLHGTKSYSGVAHIKCGDHPCRYANRSKFSFKLRKGLLKDNVYRLANKYNWRVAWQVPNNYRVLLNTEIVGATFPVVMNQLLSHYPLRATYNAKHKSMMIRNK